MYQKIKEFFDNNPQLEKFKEFWKNRAENITFVIALIVAFLFFRWMQTWWVVNIEDINAYLNVKIPASIIGCVALPIVVWFFDIITPKSFLRRISEDPIASAILLGSLALGLGLILGK